MYPRHASKVKVKSRNFFIVVFNAFLGLPQAPAERPREARDFFQAFSVILVIFQSNFIVFSFHSIVLLEIYLQLKPSKATLEIDFEVFIRIS